MDSIEQYEALLKQWGYEDNSKKVFQRKAARAAQMKKISSGIKSFNSTVTSMISQVRLSASKLPA